MKLENSESMYNIKVLTNLDGVVKSPIYFVVEIFHSLGIRYVCHRKCKISPPCIWNV